eukprot:NODE_83_length_2755_cov_85.198630_g79_i0.p1 GENE.NODE_83_length_2755_cov_85.198630_g79_i0~~NODE_83_length_2755_cov_85.198630_g79_i0.p1  ORF type:complete len:898 (+),score=258.55 NODE_83_length_2755_cov_85.198630_g79_i0:131-2695(+)
MEFEAAKAFFVEELEDATAAEERERAEREAKLAADTNAYEEDHREERIKEDVENAKERMMEAITAREDALRSQIKEYEETWESERQADADAAAAMIEEAQKELDHERHLRQAAQEEFTRKQKLRDSEVQQDAERREAMEKLQGGELTAEQYCVQLEEDLQQARQERDQQKHDLQSEVAQLKAQLSQLQTSEQEDLALEVGDLQDEIRSIAEEVQRLKQFREATLRELQEAQREEEQRITQEKKQRAAEEAAVMQEVLEEEAARDERYGSLDEVYEKLKEQRRLRLMEMQRLQTDKQLEDRDRKSMATQVDTYEAELAAIDQKYAAAAEVTQQTANELRVVEAEWLAVQRDFTMDALEQLMQDGRASIAELERALEQTKLDAQTSDAATPAESLETLQAQREAELTDKLQRLRMSLDVEKAIPRDDGTTEHQIAQLRDAVDAQRAVRQQTVANRQTLRDRSAACAKQTAQLEASLVLLAEELHRVTAEMHQFRIETEMAGPLDDSSVVETLQQRVENERAQLARETAYYDVVKEDVAAKKQQRNSTTARANGAWLKEMELVRRGWVTEKAQLDDEIATLRARLHQLRSPRSSESPRSPNHHTHTNGSTPTRQSPIAVPSPASPTCLTLPGPPVQDVSGNDKDLEILSLREQLAATQATLASVLSQSGYHSPPHLSSPMGSPERGGQGLVFSRFRASCYSANRARDMLTVTTTGAVPTVAICSKLLHSGRHTWYLQTNNGNLKCGVGMHSVTVLNAAGQQLSWVLTRTGELRHAGLLSPLLPALTSRDVVAICVDLGASHDFGDGRGRRDGVLYFSVNEAPLTPSVAGLAQHAPLVPIVELYDRGDSCVITGYHAD